MASTSKNMETESVSLLPTRKTNQYNKWLIVLVIFLLITNICTILLAVYTDIFAECTAIASTNNFESPDINITDGNQFDFNTTICAGYRQLWQDPSIELAERNVIGRAIFQTPAKVQEAIALIKLGKRYDLGRNYTMDMPFYPSIYFKTKLNCNIFPTLWSQEIGFCTMRVDTNGLGNIGTQLDYLGHLYLVDTDKMSEPDYPSNEYLRLWNGFKGSDIFNNYTGNGDIKPRYFGADKLPMFFTKAILIDIAGYKDVDSLESGYVITVEDVLGAMKLQNIELSEIGAGDVVLFYTGWSELYYTDPDLYMDLFVTPGLGKEVVTEIIFDTNAVIIGMDTWGIDARVVDPDNNETFLTMGGHEIFIPCGGGFLHENMKLDEWVMDARDGQVPWIGAYIYQPLPVEGEPTAAGKPVVFV